MGGAGTRGALGGVMRAAARRLSSALLLVAIMFAGSLLLWVGVPLGWLWIGSQIQASSGSLGLAVLAMLVGVIVSIAVLVPILGALSEAHRELRLARGRDDLGHLPLEIVMVVSATVAVVAFTCWFLLFAGSSPIPVGIGA